MKRAQLEAILRRKVRLKITRRQRGKFCVVVSAELNNHYGEESAYFPNKKQALAWLHAKLRCINEIVVEVKVVE